MPVSEPPGVPLPPRQLAAARLVALGRGTPDVAAELGVSRQAVWKWCHQPAFAAEVRRLHEQLAVARWESR